MTPIMVSTKRGHYYKEDAPVAVAIAAVAAACKAKDGAIEAVIIDYAATIALVNDQDICFYCKIGVYDIGWDDNGCGGSDSGNGGSNSGIGGGGSSNGGGNSDSKGIPSEMIDNDRRQ